MAGNPIPDITSNIKNATDFYICEFCSFSTNRMVTFTAHIAKCADKLHSGFTCSKCAYQSKDFTEFQNHCKSHIVSTKLFNCQFCSFASVSSQEFDQHSGVCTKRLSENNLPAVEKNDTKSNEFDCRDCNFFCNSSEKFEHHMSARHSVVWDYSCFHCSYKVQSFSSFSAHISRHHPEVLATDPSVDEEQHSTLETVSTINCLHCSYTSDSQIDIHEHMKLLHPSDGNVSNKRLKTDHVREDSVLIDDVVHEEKKMIRSKPTSAKNLRKKNYHCQDCPYKTNGKTLFLHHRKAHSNSIAYFCNLCVYKTVSVMLMKKHMVRVHEKEPHAAEWKVAKNGETEGSLENHSGKSGDLKCDHCSFRCNSKLSLRNHKMVHFHALSVQCLYCDYVTRSRKFMSKHVSSRHPESITGTSIIPKKIHSEIPLKSSLTFRFLKCDRCGYIARTRRDLDKHIEAHDAEFNYKCPHCLFINTCYNTFRLHMKKFHPKEKMSVKRNPLEKYNFRCEKCNYETNSEEKLEKHRLDHEEGRFFHCEICQYIAVSHVRLGKHMKLKHTQMLLKKCNQCEYTTNRTKTLRAHTMAHKDPAAYKCTSENCFFISSSLKSFVTHVSSRHPTEEKTIKGMKEDLSSSKLSSGDSEETVVRQLYKCDKCLYSTKRECVLEVHMRAHASPNALKCEHCFFLTLHKHSLEKHLAEKHSIKKTFSCNQCEFTTQRMQFFRNHTKAHESKDSYQCCVCFFLTRSYATYCNHMSSNHPTQQLLPEVRLKADDADENDDVEDDSDEDSNGGGFTCEELDCSFTTVNPHSMESHTKAHASSDKAIKCELCDYLTLSASCYKSHVKHNHPQSKLKAELYKCTKCEYKTGHSSMFKSHVKAHNSENNYSCKYCPYLTVFYQTFSTHMAKCHPDKENDAVRYEIEGYIKKDKKEYNYYCSLCSFRCMYYKLYTNHLEQVHPGAKNDYEAEHEKKKQNRENYKRYFCRECDYNTDIPAEMEDHIPTHPPDLCYVCGICNHKTTDKGLHSAHARESHPNSAAVAVNEVSVYVCPCCAFKTSSLDTYNIHLVAHPLKEKVRIEMKSPVGKEESSASKTRPGYNIICEICGFRPVNPRQLECHMLAHQSQSSHDCSKCLYKTINRQSFRKHMKVVHDIILPLGRFKRISDEEVVRAKNNKPERYRCQECGFESNSISSYKNHQDAHLATNSLKCPHCLYRTVRWVNLKSHLTRAHPSEPKAKREDIPGAMSLAAEEAALFSSPTMFRRPMFAQSMAEPTVVPVMMPRADQVVQEEVVVAKPLDTMLSDSSLRLGGV